MKIRTKIAVDYNSGANSTKTGIVEGNLVNAGWMNDFNTIGANYTYSTESGGVFFKDGFTVEGDQIEVLYHSIKDSIPENLNYRDTNRISFYLGFIFNMAQTFGIELNNIEIVE